MAGTPKTLAGPLRMANGTYVTNLYNPFSANIYGVATIINVNNITASPITFRLYRGATGANAAGTSLAFNKPVPANDFVQIILQLRFDSTDFLVGGAASDGLDITVMGFESVK